MDLDLAADVLRGDLVHVGTDLWDGVQSVPSHPEPLTLYRNRDPVTAFRISKQYTYTTMKIVSKFHSLTGLVHGLCALSLELKRVAVIAPYL